MTKRLALQINNTKIKESVINYFRGKDVEICEQDNADLIALYDDSCDIKKNTINLHPSLLPSFKGKDAIKESYLAGVKVSGITIHRVEPDNFYGKIIAQVPILIGNDTHFDEFETEIINIASKIFPKVIETVLEGKVFDFSDLFKSSGCGGNCSSCGGCKH